MSVELIEFAKIIGAKLQFTGELDPATGERYINVSLVRGGTKASIVAPGGGQSGTFGRDETGDPQQALADQAAHMAGKKIVFDSPRPGDDKPIFCVPEDLVHSIPTQQSVPLPEEAEETCTT